MALLKDIKLDSGMTVSYHMISYYGVDVVRSLLNITVNSYVSKETRDKEKQYYIDKTKQMALRAQIGEEQAKENPDERLLAELNSQLTDFPEDPNTCIKSESIFLQPVYDENRVWEVKDFYEILKSLEAFEGAEDI